MELEAVSPAGSVQLDARRSRNERDPLSSAVVASKKMAADGIAELQLRRADRQPWPAWAPGSHIDLVLPGGLVRQYSLCGDREDLFHLRIGVLREPESRGGSAFVHDSLRPGDHIEVRGPRNAFQLGTHDRYIFIAGGIGITPILPMINEVNRRGADWELHYGGRSRTSMAFIDELVDTGGDVRLYPQDETGFIPLAEILETGLGDIGVYACGPAPLLEAIEAYEKMWPEGSINMERFVAGEKELVRDHDRPFEVVLATSGLSVDVSADETILSAVERHGIGVLSSCRAGTCGTCETPVLEGVPDHRDSVLDDEDRARGDCMMICVSRALSNRLVLDL